MLNVLFDLAGHAGRHPPDVHLPPALLHQARVRLTVVATKVAVRPPRGVRDARSHNQRRQDSCAGKTICHLRFTIHICKRVSFSPQGFPDCGHGEEMTYCHVHEDLNLTSAAAI
jgi:hypothetical protein